MNEHCQGLLLGLEDFCFSALLDVWSYVVSKFQTYKSSRMSDSWTFEWSNASQQKKSTATFQSIINSMVNEGNNKRWCNSWPTSIWKTRLKKWNSNTTIRSDWTWIGRHGINKNNKEKQTRRKPENNRKIRTERTRTGAKIKTKTKPKRRGSRNNKKQQ